jgi:hypothetical protein
MQEMENFLIGCVNTGFARSIPPLEVGFTLLRSVSTDPNDEISCYFRLSEEKFSILEIIFNYLN